MKQSEIVVGQNYLTLVSGELREVEVVRIQNSVRLDAPRRMRFVVRVPGSATPLPKARTAAALRPVACVDPYCSSGRPPADPDSKHYRKCPACWRAFCERP